MTHTAQDFATFCKKKGFIYQSSELYGGLSGFYDYGHLGSQVKRNFENLWRSYFLGLHDNFHEIDTAQIMHENVFKASGHLENFTDPVAVCEKGHFERSDHLIEKELDVRAEGLDVDQMRALIKEKELVCPVCGGVISDVRHVNMMFPIELGVGKVQKAYLRPETAQSPYVNFKLQFELLRKKLPMGLALIGRAFRNEISPRNMTLRLRALVQAELQIFFNPSKIESHPKFGSVKDYKLRTLRIEDREKDAVIERSAQDLVDSGLPQFYVYHLVKIQQFYLDVLRISCEKFRFLELNEKEKAFYNKFHFDIEVELFDHGFTEMGGLHYRTDHDLKGHQKVSKVNLAVLDESTGEKFVPHVLELSFGVDRNVYMLLDLNYELKAERGNDVLRLPSPISPFQVAVFPLVKNKPELLSRAQEVYDLLRVETSCFWDQSGSIGRRYARADEVGTRWCVTVDFESLDDGCVTVRDRETTEQKRVKIADLVREVC